MITVEQLANMVDHTNLKAFADDAAFTKLCDEARKYNFKMVAINPAQTVRCKNNLKNKKIVIDEKTKRVNEESFIKYMLKLDSSTLLMSINGTIGNLAMYHGENVILGKSVAYMSVIDSVLRRDFLYYLLQTTHIKQSLFQNVTGGTIKNLGLAVIRNFKIPVPSLTEQERIVKILDKYDTYTRDMISTLNTELESRKKQYAYYRDQLLTFKRKE